MTFVVVDNCVKCKYTDCVEVCPVDCFHEGPNFLVIDPDECIACTLCEPECPAEAIFAEDDLPEDQVEYVALNAELAKEWPVITEKKAAPTEADERIGKKHIFDYLERGGNSRTFFSRRGRGPGRLSPGPACPPRRPDHPAPHRRAARPHALHRAAARHSRGAAPAPPFARRRRARGRGAAGPHLVAGLAPAAARRRRTRSRNRLSRRAAQRARSR